MPLSTPTEIGFGSGDDVASIATGSFTPPNNSLLIAKFTAAQEGTAALTVSGGSLTWVQQEYNPRGGYAASSGIWTAEVTTGASMSVTISGDTFYDGSLSVGYVTGYDTSTPVQQTFGDSGDSVSGPYTSALGSPSSSGNAVVAAAFVDGGAADVDIDAAWNEQREHVGPNGRTGSYQYFLGATSDVHWDEITTGLLHGGYSVSAIEVNAAAGSSHDLTPDDLSASSSVDAATFGQEHALTANDVASGSSIGLAALGQAHALSPSDIGSDPAVDQPALGQEHNLTGNDLTASPTVSNPSLAEGQALTPNDLGVSTSVGTPSLGQAHALVPSDISAVPSTQAVSLGQVHALSLDELTSAPTVGQPTLTEGTGLTPNDLAAATNVTTASLGQTHALAPQSITAAPSLGQLSLLPPYIELSPRGLIALSAVSEVSLRIDHGNATVDLTRRGPTEHQISAQAYDEHSITTKVQTVSISARP